MQVLKFTVHGISWTGDRVDRGTSLKGTPSLTDKQSPDSKAVTQTFIQPFRQSHTHTQAVRHCAPPRCKFAALHITSLIKLLVVLQAHERGASNQVENELVLDVVEEGWCSPGWRKMRRFALKPLVTAISRPNLVARTYRY